MADIDVYLGDADLDGRVDGHDFMLWNGTKFTLSLQWNNGDCTGRGGLHWAGWIALGGDAMAMA